MTWSSSAAGAPRSPGSTASSPGSPASPTACSCRPDDLDERPTARMQAFVIAPERSAEDILAELRGRIDPVFLPRRVVRVEALPRNELGKLPRSALRACRRSGSRATDPASMHCVGCFRIPADHPALPGHFPGRPLVPGVLVLDAALALIDRRDCRAGARRLRAREVPRPGPGRSRRWRSAARAPATAASASPVAATAIDVALQRHGERLAMTARTGVAARERGSRRCCCG